jgi:hypothetical protein
VALGECTIFVLLHRTKLSIRQKDKCHETEAAQPEYLAWSTESY